MCDINGNSFCENSDNNDNMTLEDELRECVQQYLQKNSELVAKLEDLSQNIQKHSSNCNIAKTVGTSVSGVGSVGAVAALGMAFAPMTAGFSTVVTTGAIVTAGVGSLTTIGTVIVDSYISKKFVKEIVNLAEQKNKCVSELKEKFYEFSNVLSGDNNHNYINNSYDGFAIMKSVLSGGTEMYQLGRNSVAMVESISELKALNAAQTTGNVSSNSAKFVESVREMNVVSTVNNGKNLFTSFVKNVMNFGSSGEKAGIDLFVKTTGPTVGKALFKSATALAGVAFTVVDVITLVKDWNKHQPTIELVQELIDQLMNEAKNVIFHYNILTVDEFDDQLINDIISFVECRNSDSKCVNNRSKTDSSVDNQSNSISSSSIIFNNNNNDGSVRFTGLLND